MRIKDSPKSNAESGSKKESKKKNVRQKAESKVTGKNEKSGPISRTEKEGQKRSPPKDEGESKVLPVTVKCFNKMYKKSIGIVYQYMDELYRKNKQTTNM